jgi:hypothetical protein
MGASHRCEAVGNLDGVRLHASVGMRTAPPSAENGLTNGCRRTIGFKKRFLGRCNDRRPSVMRLISIAALTAAAVLTFTASSVSAAVICNDEGDCWRVKEERRYEPSLGLRVMPDNWRWKEGER